MEEIRVNISASFEDQGWKSFVNTYQGEDKEWTKVYGDVRSNVNKLLPEESEKPLYRIIDAKCGTSFCKIRRNPVDTRGGYLQVSLFIKSGKRIDSAVKSILDNVDEILPKGEDLCQLFVGDQSQKTAFVEKTNEILKSISIVDDYKIDSQVYIQENQEQKTVYRTYGEDDELNKEYFSFPHQKSTSGYKSVYFVQKNNKPLSGDAIEITEPISHVFRIKNGTDVYEVLEGTSCDVKCIKYSNINDVEPKVLTINTTPKETFYTTKDYEIIVDEDKLKFTKSKLCVYVEFPELAKFEEKKDLTVRLKSNKSIEGRYDGGSLWVFENLDMSNKYSLEVCSNFFKTKVDLPKDIDLSDSNKIAKLQQQQSAIKLEFVKRKVDLAESRDAIMESISKDKIKIVKVLSNGVEVPMNGNSITIEKNKQYQFVLSMDKNFTFDIDLAKIKCEKKKEVKKSEKDTKIEESNEKQQNDTRQGFFSRILETCKNNIPILILSLVSFASITLSVYLYVSKQSQYEEMGKRISKIENEKQQIIQELTKTEVSGQSQEQ